jgi:hypothetical protein
MTTNQMKTGTAQVFIQKSLFPIDRRFTNLLFSNLGEVSNFFSQTINGLTAKMVKSLCVDISTCLWALFGPFWYFTIV